MASPIDFHCDDCPAEAGRSCAGTLTGTYHKARRKTLSDWQIWTEDNAIREYMAWWMQEFGDIFQEV